MKTLTQMVCNLGGLLLLFTNLNMAFSVLICLDSPQQSICMQ